LSRFIQEVRDLGVEKREIPQLVESHIKEDNR
jgi:DNA-binding transcriptional regulator YhcF (GntR family)